MKIKKTAILSLILCSSFLVTNCEKVVPNPIPYPYDDIPGASPSVSPSPTSAPVTASSEKIAFMSNRNGFWEIYTMNPDGTNQEQITNSEMRNAFPFSVSPDGTRFAYVSDKSGNADLYVYDHGSKLTAQITDTPDAEEGSPSWMPDSSSLIFHSNIKNRSTYEILEVDYPTRNDSQFRTLISRSGSALHPTISPKGSDILFSLSDSSGISSLYIYDNFTKEDIKVTDMADGAINGNWSPDGTKIIYWTTANGFFTVNRDGTDKQQIGTIKNIKGVPSYSPDGTKISVSRGFGFSEDFNVWSMDSDGRNLKKLTDLGGISIVWFADKGNIPVNLPSPTSSPIGVNPNNPFQN